MKPAQSKTYFLGLQVSFHNGVWTCTGLWWCAIGATQSECISNATYLLEHY